MNVEERKKLVAGLLGKAKSAALREAEIVKQEEHLTLEFLQEHLYKYILSKYLLGDDVQEDNIRELAKLSVQRTMKLDSKMLRNLDQATPCDHATSDSTKKALLLFSIQIDFGIRPNVEQYAAVESVAALTELVYDELQKQR